MTAEGAFSGELTAVRQSARSVPVVRRVDVVVVGGNTWAVTAAIEAAKHGAHTLLLAPRPYLGDDLCGTLRLELGSLDSSSDELARRFLADGTPVVPLHVKKVLDEALLGAGVQFLFGCYVTDVLQDAEQRPCGVIVANRAGRQAIVAKVVVDATDRACVARLAGAKTSPWLSGKCKFHRTILMPGKQGSAQAVEKTLELSIQDGSFAALAEAEQKARDTTYVEGQLRASEHLFYVPADPVVGRARAAMWKETDSPDLNHFRPDGLDRLYVVGPCADLPRQVAERLLQPCAMMPIGRMIGRAAAKEANALKQPVQAGLPEEAPSGSDDLDIRETLIGLRPTESAKASIAIPRRSVPVLGQYDVVVVGGGTAGAPAAIAAGRQGAKVLVLEYQEGLGGVGTLGLIGHPYQGKLIGFTREVPYPDAKSNMEAKMEWYRREIRKVGGEIWLGVLGCGAVMEGSRVRGVAVATPAGRGVVLARAVIDATGNADIAVAAGADSIYGATEQGDIAMQGAGLPHRPLKAIYVNTDHLLVDESDLLDVWRTLVGTRLAMDAADFDAAPFIQTRERRRIVGDHVLTYLDQIAGRTYPDSIAYSASDYDSHGYPTHPFFALIPHDEKSRKANHPAPGGQCYTPYRCLLPRGIDGLLIVGLGISMERDASAMIRMQRDLANQGYAAGVAAAMAARQDVGVREIDVRELQRRLVEVGNLPAEALEHRDSFPLSEEELQKAVRELVAQDRAAASRALAVVLIHRTASIGPLMEAYEKSDGEAKLRYALVLGFFGQPEVVPTLVEELEKVKQWDAKILQGKMAEYAHLPTPVDAVILALGYTKDRRALPAILDKLAMLDAKTTLSHHRAVAIALEALGDRAAAEPLAQLLAKPGMTGHAMTKLEPLGLKADKGRREAPLREIVLARALYRCGDFEEVGVAILKQYQNDLRGLFARHACSVLEKSEPAGSQAKQ